IYLSKGVITVEGENLENAKISGTALNEEFTKYQAANQEIKQQMAALDQEYEAASDAQKNDPAFIGQLQERASQIYSRQHDFNNQYIANNPQSYITMSLIGDMLSAENVKDMA